MAEPWDRLRNEYGHPLETKKAYDAFLVYRDAGADRSLSFVARALSKSAALMARWSKNHSWVSRADAWDQLQDALRKEAEARAAEARFAAQQQEAIEMGARHARAAVAMQQVALTRLQGLQQPEALANLGARDLTYMMDVAVKIERLSRGQPSERIELLNTVLTPLLEQLIVVFMEVNAIEDPGLRAEMFGAKADQVVEAVVGRIMPALGVTNG